MSAIIHIAAEAEPTELHGHDDALEIFGAHLAIEMDVADEDSAEAAVEAFLTALPLGKFFLFAIDSANAVTNLGELDRAHAVSASDGAVMAWLRDARDAFRDLANQTKELSTGLRSDDDIAFFNSPSRTDADMRNARAVDLLRATAKWPAPIAQNAGLTVPLICNIARDETSHNVVVFIDAHLDVDTLTFAAEVDVNAEIARLTVTTPDGSTFNIHTGIVERYDESTLGALFEKTGKFKTLENADALARLTSRIEELAPSLLTSSAIMDDIALNENLVRTLAGLADDDAIPPETELPEAVLHLLMQAGIVTLFDVPMIALQLPAPAPNNTAFAVPRSAILQRLSRGIASRFEQENPALDVDEGLLYARLHAALHSILGTLHTAGPPQTLERLWTSLAPVIADNDRMPLLEKAVVGEIPEARIAWFEWREKVEDYSAQLAELAVLLESEAGAESWFLGLCDSAFLKDGAFAIDLGGTGIPEDQIDPTLTGPELDEARANLTAKLTSLYRAFRDDIEGRFNAAEAMRRDFGALVLAELSKGITLDNPDDLTFALSDSDWFRRRVAGVSNPPRALDGLIAPCIPLPLINQPAITELLASAFHQRSKEILAKTEALQRFRPDASPQPLPIRITDKIDPEQIDRANARTCGLGFLIRSKTVDGSASEDHHINLVALLDRKTDDAVIADPTVLPTRPVMTPGSAGLFVTYGGAPLASPNRPKPGQGGADMDPVQFAQSQMERRVRGYRIEDSADTLPLPALAYGRRYAVAGYWLPGSGVLPAGVRRAGSNLFAPGSPSAEFHAPDDALVPYLRRTAIGDMELRTKTDLPKDVHPLANDDPRLVLECFNNGRRQIDLNRRADGTGGLKGENRFNDDGVQIGHGGEISLHGVAFSGDLVTDHLAVKVLGEADAEIGTATLALDGDILTIVVELSVQSAAYWLRLMWKTDAPTGGCLSFNDPAHEQQQDSAGRQSPVAVLAPDSSGWTSAASQDVTLDAPRVSFADFECWARNISLWADSAGNTEEAKKLFATLRWAQAVFEETGDAYAEKMNRLPDPAVRSLELFAAGSDHLDGDRSLAGQAHLSFEISPYDPATLPLPSSPGIAVPGANKLTPDQLRQEEDEIFLRKIQELRDLIDAIHDRARVVFKIQSGSGTRPSFSFDQGHILTVPEGWVVRLAAQPAVPRRYFEGMVDGIAFDNGMLQLAQGSIDEMVLFDGAKLQIEAMTGIPNEMTVPASTLQSTTRGAERAYALDFLPRGEDRIFAAAQLIVQQSRPTGRPIYRWIDPVPKGRFAERPVVGITSSADQTGEVGHVTAAALDAFEADAFFGIGRDDADRKSVIRLQPAPAVTRLGTQEWPERSAAYFRHRLELRSRYVGAMLDPTLAIVSVEETGAARWATRTVILADPLAADLTRPQLRAFFPVQRMVQKDTNTPIPPVACVLAEPPFEQLGLADRLDADLKTINTYRINEEPFGDEGETRDRLRVDGLRKELGPDPRLSYFPVEDKEARAALLAVEGPVGLHFEADTVSAPAFSNSQFLLHVAVDDTGVALPAELEESFAGVSLSRYSDPAWSYVRDIESRSVPVGSLPGYSASWIDLDASLKIGTDETSDVVRIEETGGQYTISVSATALFKEGGEGFKELCQVAANSATASILIRPLGDDRYLLSVHKTSDATSPDEVMDQGRIDRPQLIASVSFKASGTLQFRPAVQVRATRQSDATFVEWVRTARDMSHVALRGEDDEAQSDQRLRLDELTPVLPTSGRGRLVFQNANAEECRISSPITLRRYPLHVHRHLALLVRKPSAQIGHQIDLFDQALLADGWGQAVLDVAPGASVSLAELETRAEMVRVQGGPPRNDGLERYNSGHFDLASSRARPVNGQVPNPIRQMRLHFRAANQPLDLRLLRFDLRIPGAPQRDEVVLSLDPAIVSSRRVWSFDLFLFQQPNGPDGNEHMPRWSIRWPGSDEEQKGEIPSLAQFFGAESFDLTVVDQANLTDDRWLDVSLLHSVKLRGSSQSPLADSFDFDWLFGTVSGDEALPNALTPVRLNHLPEAQARLIGQSDPLDIQFK
ncbi:hypothetical protein [Ruegeria sp.]|uniref:hypothetical protein n=1 Tax=Ruegeria sp. TaxID=1879320 RepID=UPI00230903AE|nr:hypothetical protein [Ruegeria sp.]MDA7963929.1 hypothetical protein [Ruegeria sp.]